MSIASFFISRSHCASSSSAVFAMAVGLPEIIDAEECNGWLK